MAAVPDPASRPVRVEARGAGTIAVSGPLGFASVLAARREVSRLLAGAAPTEVDLGGVAHTDSAGLALLVHWVREARFRGTEIRFRNVPDQMRAIARTTGLDGLLDGWQENG